MAANKRIAAGMIRRRRVIRIILLVALSAALCVAASKLPTPSSLRNISIDSLYWWLDVATWGVIVGVAIEEFTFVIDDVAKFLRIFIRYGLKSAFHKLRSHWRRIPEAFGFLILVAALVYEFELQTRVRGVESDVRLKMEAQIAPRRLLASDRDRLIRAIRPFSKEGVAFDSYVSDGEAYAFGIQLAETFAKTGIWVDPGAKQTSGLGH
jgi:hypothetical protein